VTLSLALSDFFFDSFFGRLRRYRELLSVMAAADDVSQAKAVWADMIKAQIAPDAVAYLIMLTLCVESATFVCA
jgi:pentatricopeptide repeat protein